MILYDDRVIEDSWNTQDAPDPQQPLPLPEGGDIVFNDYGDLYILVAAYVLMTSLIITLGICLPIIIAREVSASDDELNSIDVSDSDSELPYSFDAVEDFPDPMVGVDYGL